MAASVLSLVLSENIPISQIIHWIQFKEKTFQCEFQCSLGEFISNLLNFIHEEALCFEKYRETPKKVHTPKAIRKLELPTKPKRRSALFNESSKSNFPISPVSPIYTRLNSSLPLNSPSSQDSKTSTPGKSSKQICLGDFLSPNRKPVTRKTTTILTTPTSEKKQNVRRLNPTNLTLTDRTPIKSENSFDFKNNAEDNHNLKKKTDEELIKELESKVGGTSKKSPKLNQQEIPPDLNKVTKKLQLDILSVLYLEVIKTNGVLNVTSELYFIITLLLSKQYDRDYFSSKVFCSIHNVVYFALECLRHFILSSDTKSKNNCGLVSLFDKSTLRLLANNGRIKALDEAIVEKLLTLSEDELSRKSSVDLSNDIDTHTSKNNESNVCFEPETDNRENFPSESSFHAFRKQRDIFYEILHIWETNHSSEGWNFTLGLGGKIKALIGMHNEPANYKHLARLIKSQLLITCSKTKDETLSENHLSILSNFPNLNTEKLNRLKSRLVVKDSCTGINSPPTFPDSQEFYKEFIEHAQTHIFCVHMKNVFVQDLLQLNDITFEVSDVSQQLSRNNYCTTVKSLQLLAKFIAFIEGLPYKSSSSQSNESNKLTMEEIESRSWSKPPIDLNLKLSNASKNNHLVIVIPWIVEYLAMLDGTTLRLPYYEPLYEKLFRIFNSLGNLPLSNRQLIECCLGWLFEQNHFPSEMYFHYLNNFQSFEVEQKANIQSFEGAHNLDLVEIIDVQILHQICPFLKEFKKLLQYNCNRNGSITSKHITPVTSIQSISDEINEKRLKLQLQESFLNSKPSSLRKTLEFVSERVASSIVKTICNHIVPQIKVKANYERKNLLVNVSEGDIANCEVMMDLTSKSLKLTEKHLKVLREECDNCLKQQIHSKIPQGVLALLSSDELAETVNVCSEIASRMCEDRVKQWINTHVNNNVFKDFDLDSDKANKLIKKESAAKQKFEVLPTQGRAGVEHIDSDDDDNNDEDQEERRVCRENQEGTKRSAISTIWNPSKVMTHFQSQCARLLASSPMGGLRVNSFHFLSNSYQDLVTLSITSVEIIGALQHAQECYDHRSDLAEVTWHLINQQIVDYFILLCTHFPQVLSIKLLNKFLNFWESHREDTSLDDLFNGIISVRNTVILMTATKENSKEAWKFYALLLQKLLDSKLLTCDSFETQCLAVFRHDWDSLTLQKFCKCLRSVVQGYGKHDVFAFLLEFLADYCVDLDF